MSNIGQQYTFWNLINEYKIVVPKIQRDYVQGRENDTVKKNREEFVEELIDSLAGGRPMSLNFIYGMIRENDFIPIDGQQRLTTLFLLHLYVFAKKRDTAAIEKLQKQFSYQTRYTTNRFLEKLAEELPEMLKSVYFNDKFTLIDIIRDSGWYVTSWDNDPNIRSSLVMLQTIHKTCKDIFAKNNDDVRKFFNRLTNVDCPITFMWLQLDKSFGSDNQLYIRMNSRGKQLTDFENFKAEIYEKILTDVGGKNAINKFKEKIDGDWYSLLWEADIDESNVEKGHKKDIEKEAMQIDSLLKRIIHWTIVSAACVKLERVEKPIEKQGKENGKRNESDEQRKLRERQERLYQFCTPDGVDILRCDVQKYGEIVQKEEIESFLLVEVNKFFEFLCNIQKQNKNIFLFVKNDILKISQDGKDIKFTLDSYKPRVLFYAITRYAKLCYENRKGYEVNDFNTWYRVVLNLVSTKEIGRPENFQKAVQVINQWEGDIEKWLNTTAKDAFRPEQVEEEKQKLNLIKSGEKWKDAILQAEKTDFDHGYQERDYFRGQIGFLLLMSKEDGDYNVNKFNKIYEAAKKIFIDEYDDNLFHRALLTYEDYGTDLKSINQEESSRTVSYGITTYFRKTSIHGAPDWRDALIVVNWDKKESCKANMVYIALKRFIEEFINTSSTELKKFQQDKIERYNDRPPTSLRDKLIMKRKMFEFTDNYFIKKDEEEKDILLRSKTKTGEKGRNWDYADEYYDSSEGEEGQTS